MTECMHGFDEGLCDICFPRVTATPVPAAAAPAARTARSRTITTPAPRRAAGAAASAPKGPPFAKRRLYHATHVRNLESIVLDGALKPIGPGVQPDVDVSAPIIRELRITADVGDGRTVADFVPFWFTPDAERWVELRDGAEGAHWSPAARMASPTEFVVLVVEASSLDEDEVVVADGDASAPLTRYTIGGAGRAVARLSREDPSLGAAELLVPDAVPIEHVVLLGVANEPIRSRVRSMFADVGRTAPKVVVHPPWFTPAEA